MDLAMQEMARRGKSRCIQNQEQKQRILMKIEKLGIMTQFVKNLNQEDLHSMQ